MPRPKGSKNKPKTNVDRNEKLKTLEANAKAEAELVEKLSLKTEELASELMEAKKQLRAAKTKLARSTREKETLEAQAAEEQRKVEATKLVEQFLASGKSVEDFEAAIKNL